MENTELRMKEGKSYSWKEDSSFTITGREVSILYNSLSNILSTDSFKNKLIEAKETFTIVELHKTMSQVLNKGLEDGVVTEVHE
jgi:hypothetical protein